MRAARWLVAAHSWPDTSRGGARAQDSRYDRADKSPREIARQRVGALRIVTRRRAGTPYRPRPCGVARAARDDMDVQLAHDVAERADIDLVDASPALEYCRDVDNLLQQYRTIGGV